MSDEEIKKLAAHYAFGDQVGSFDYFNGFKKALDHLQPKLAALESRNEDLVKALESIAHNCSYGDDGDVDDLLNTIDYTQKEAKEALLNHGTKPNENE